MSQEIIIAIIAASLGAAVTQVVTFLLSCLDKKHQKNVLLRQKYEEMALVYSKSLLWFQIVSSSTTNEELHEHSVHYEARQAYILCQIYFPKLQSVAAEYLNASCTYYDSLVKGFNPSINVSALLQAEIKPEHKSVVEKMTKARQSFDKAIQQYANLYAKA